MSGDPLDKEGSADTLPPPLNDEREEREKTPDPVLKDDGSKDSYRSRSRISSGKTLVIECRVCSKSMKLQNYKTHLKFQHPKEDSDNLRTKSNQSIKNLFGGKTETRILKRPSPFSEPETTNTKRISPTLVPADMNQNIPPIVFTDSADNTDECYEGPSHVIEQFDNVDVNKVEEGQVPPKHDADQLDNVSNEPNEDQNEVTVDVLENLVAKLAPLAELEDKTIKKIIENK